MFNLLKKKKTMYTNFNEVFDAFLTEPSKINKTIKTYSNFEAELLEDGKQLVTVNTTGHNPKDIKVEVTEDVIIIKAKKGESTSRFVSDIDLELSVGKDYDGTKSDAKFENGLLLIAIDKKNERKAKALKISY
jgi:HSP20 family molecular chaperone IbpA